MVSFYAVLCYQNGESVTWFTLSTEAIMSDLTYNAVEKFTKVFAIGTVVSLLAAIGASFIL